MLVNISMKEETEAKKVGRPTVGRTSQCGSLSFLCWVKCDSVTSCLCVEDNMPLIFQMLLHSTYRVTGENTTWGRGLTFQYHPDDSLSQLVGSFYFSRESGGLVHPWNSFSLGPFFVFSSSFFFSFSLLLNRNFWLPGTQAHPLVSRGCSSYQSYGCFRKQTCPLSSFLLSR